MQLSGDDLKRRKLRYYLSINMPEVRKVSSIIAVIEKYAGAVSKKTIQDGLLWGQGPMVQVVKNLGAFGEYQFGTNIIKVDDKLVKEFEAGKDLCKTPKGQLVYLLGVTLLHELTHWADDQDGVDDPIAHDPTNEEGQQFEIDLYGGVIDRSHRI